jgi:hypothetical protein
MRLLDMSTLGTEKNLFSTIAIIEVSASSAGGKQAACD